MRWLEVSKPWGLVVVLLLALGLSVEAGRSLGIVTGPVAVAQDEPAEEPAAAEEPAGKPQQSYLAWFFKALGIRYTIAFLALSFSFVAILVMNFLVCRRDSFVPRHLIDAFEAHLNEKRFQEAFDLAKNDESFLGQMLSSGMANLQAGYDKAMEAMAETAEDEGMKIEHRLSYISLIASISPLVGLLGTVDGMVASFQVIAISGATPKASDLAEGISMALITTLVGLVLAIPAILAFNLFKNRISRLTMEAGHAAGRLMGRFESMGKK
ncbi:Biopolymer transport protein ExbB [Anatilimnocola aggregata]|uniref:Biopolymer transport protein ExbB n=1 Tax=Anatilimnocola aggregata TaxID=2528021 RepID=A0A517Y5C3_9BACT|nr:MotA/TolQ/ExbB proton channel family protein [Anatilimnocola aggregata]QDU25322.1 Biopolymer transport protein ExbB [Anatilimnocola aggregata]